MTRVMAVSFVRHGQLHFLGTDEEFRVGDTVLYPTSGGPEVAFVVWPPTEIDSEASIPKCQGRATEADLKRAENLRIEREEATKIAKTMIEQHGLPMQVVAVDVMDRLEEVDKLVAVYFRAEGRVDFRALVGDLARALRARVDLRQIGARDETRVTGGLGSCGRPLCCSTWLDDFEPISVRLARTQELQTNLLQISGACGKLLCCLRFENEMYQDFFANAPADGTRVTTPEGIGCVVGHNVPAGTLNVLLDEGGERNCPAHEVCTLTPHPRHLRKNRWKMRRESDSEKK